MSVLLFLWEVSLSSSIMDLLWLVASEPPMAWDCVGGRRLSVKNDAFSGSAFFSTGFPWKQLQTDNYHHKIRRANYLEIILRNKAPSIFPADSEMR